MPPTIHLVRHAQGYHNLCVENETMRDPDLTPLGEQQCLDLRASFPYHDKLTRLVASPMRRTLWTCTRAFGPDDGGAPYPIVALDTLQELSDLPSDTGSSVAALSAEFDAARVVDLSQVRDGLWTDKLGDTPFEPTKDKIEARAREARRSLRELAGLSTEDHVAVVTHGAFLHFLTDEFQDIPNGNATSWKNCEYRSYQFVDLTGADEDAAIVETDESWQRRRGDKPRLSQHDLDELRVVAHGRIVPHLKASSHL
ncbi:phosphoglycerate mutase family protein [Cordyceps fumosorosea ARSEF 2679]|uniref:Phosphoglycerate mutase family protein n=1 Tax=Cordyceps fumosorosea (strain ARSEF 2679) TaxID=1081104 RepID=A0A168BLH9_CORFA|nr:phosphoglycerate mutase family protein [Cordyceps fumosorosea ARSEF 2679]OAA70271.1 phosphoglycerate mutase family protein [Cordyceps fumosorosea ARSEF 2679]